MRLQNLTTKKLVLVGGGEHAMVVVESAKRLLRWETVGYVDQHRKKRWPDMWLGGDEWFRKHHSEYFVIICCKGKPRDNFRARVIDGYKDIDVSWATIIDPSSNVSFSVKIGVGVYVAPGAVINTETVIGDHCIINTGSIIEHNCNIGTNVHIAPGVTMGGSVSVGKNSTIGLGAKVRDHINIGENVVVGMGAVVVKDILDGKLVIGVPGKVISDV